MLEQREKEGAAAGECFLFFFLCAGIDHLELNVVEAWLCLVLRGFSGVSVLKRPLEWVVFPH